MTRYKFDPHRGLVDDFGNCILQIVPVGCTKKFRNMAGKELANKLNGIEPERTLTRGTMSLGRTLQIHLSPTDFARSLEARVAELEALTDGIDWKEWHDCAEILASQEGWKRVAEIYLEALKGVAATMKGCQDVCWDLADTAIKGYPHWRNHDQSNAARSTGTLWVPMLSMRTLPM